MITIFQKVISNCNELLLQSNYPNSKNSSGILISNVFIFIRPNGRNNTAVQ